MLKTPWHEEGAAHRDIKARALDWILGHNLYLEMFHASFTFYHSYFVHALLTRYLITLVKKGALKDRFINRFHGNS